MGRLFQIDTDLKKQAGREERELSERETTTPSFIEILKIRLEPELYPVVSR